MGKTERGNRRRRWHNTASSFEPRTTRQNMSHTYSTLIFHVVFSTKGHAPVIVGRFRQELYPYMAALIREQKGRPLIINGVDDHVHILMELPPSVCLSTAMRFIKANSSRWASEKFHIAFSWQTGFGAFSVSRSGVEAVSSYIRDQETHHKKFDFKREFEMLLDKNGVEYDTRYLWPDE